jgi:hypothetical protein
MLKVLKNEKYNNANTLLATGFRPIEELDLNRAGKRVIVTNNINSRDKYGQRQFIWIVEMVHYSDGEYTAFAIGDRRIRNITHFCELP